jgi:bacteriorhodopsin
MTAGTLGAEQASIPGLTDQALAAVGKAAAEANADAFRYVFYAVIAFGILAIACACLTVNYSKTFTDDVARKLHGKGTGLEEKNDKNDVVD